MNYQIFRLINGLAYKNAALDAVMIFSSKYLPYIIALLVAAVFFTGIVRRDKACVKGAVTSCLLAAVNLAINFVIGRFLFCPRPFASYKVNMLYSHVADSSFPSDHATFTMSAAAGLMRARRALGWMCVGLSLLVGFSRIYVGHHYPLDVAASYLIVLATDVLYRLLLEKKVSALLDRAQEKLFHSR
jgi:undecaprenyl-diphosphatase